MHGGGDFFIVRYSVILLMLCITGVGMYKHHYGKKGILKGEHVPFNGTVLNCKHIKSLTISKN